MHAIDGVAIDELVRLADGTLPPSRRAAVEARVARSPEATEALRTQRRAVAAIQSFAPPVPAGLEARVRARATRPARPTLPALKPVLAGACAAALALAVAIMLSPSGGGLTVDAVAAVSSRPALEVPGPKRAGDGTLERAFAGLTFPDWGNSHGWHAVGARRDRVDGRTTDTVYYRHTHHRVGYTVLDGRPLGLPDRGRRIERNGVVIQLYHDGPRTVAVFERGGRTCVLAGVVHFEETLVKLASWRAEGALAF